MMDPGIIHVLGFTVKGKFYFDVVLTMGLRIACFICQRITNALMYIYHKQKYEGINYLDDLGAAEIRRLAWAAFLALGKLLKDLGIWEAENKASPPAPVMTFLGVECDAKLQILRITLDRLSELRKLLESWTIKKSASLRQVQSLAGKLNFVCSTVRAGRVFLTRIFEFIASFEGTSGVRPITEEFRRDINWWRSFIVKFNGITMFPEQRWFAPDRVFSTDSCLAGCGGWGNGEFFHCEFPVAVIKQYKLTINELECWAIVIAIKIWQAKLHNKNLLLHCDNTSTVEVVNKGRARNPFTQTCLREIAWITANCNCWVKVCFLPGVQNRISDSLSRWHLDDMYAQRFHAETKGVITKEIKVTKDMFKFSTNW